MKKKFLCILLLCSLLQGCGDVKKRDTDLESSVNAISASQSTSQTTSSSTLTTPVTTNNDYIKISSSNIQTLMKRSSSIQLNFTESMNASATEQNFSVAPSVTGTISWNSNFTSFTFNPSNLAYSTDYTVVLGKDSQGQSGKTLDETFTASFKTMAESTQLIPVSGTFSTSNTISNASISVIDTDSGATATDSIESGGNFALSLMDFISYATKVGNTLTISVTNNGNSVTLSSATYTVTEDDIFSNSINLSVSEQ